MRRDDTIPRMIPTLAPGHATTRFCIAAALLIGGWPILLGPATPTLGFQDSKTPLGAEGAPSARPDWLRIVPAEAHFYSEIHDLSKVRAVFRNLGIWTHVRELSEEERPGAATRPWQRQAEELLGMDAEAAIDRVLGRRAALIASEPSEWQNGVLLAELGSVAELRPLLKQWQAHKLESDGDVDRYSLAGGLMLAARDTTFALGPPGDPEGLWGRTVLLLAGRRGPNLAGRAEFAALRSRMSSGYQGLLYVSWPDGGPGAVAGCSRLLTGVWFADSQIACELHGQRASPAGKETPSDAGRIGTLPASSLAVVTDSYDFEGLGRAVREDRVQQAVSLIAFTLAVFTSLEDSSNNLIDRLGPAYTVVLGSAPDSGKGVPALPAVSALCRTPDGATCITQLDIVFTFLAQLFEALNTTEGQEPREIYVRRRDCEGVEMHSVELGEALAKRFDMSALSSFEPCWCVLDDRLLVSSSAAHVREIILAARGKVPRLDTLAAIREVLPGKEEAATVGQWMYLRAGAASALAAKWLDYLERARPEWASDRWWKDWASERLQRVTRLGVGLEPDKTSPVRAIVREVEIDSPARGQLQPGDIIVGAAGRALTTTRPAQEVRERYRQRGNARRFDLRVVRSGEMLDLSIPVQPADPLHLREFEPVRALRRLVALTRRVEAVMLRRDIAKPDRLEARVVIRWTAAP